MPTPVSAAKSKIKVSPGKGYQQTKGKKTLSISAGKGEEKALLDKSPSKFSSNRKSKTGEFALAADNPRLVKLRSVCAKISANPFFNAFTTLLTIQALFGDDIRVATTHQDTDNVFNACTIFCILVFAFEVFVQSLGKPDYFPGFFFWLDVISTVTLVLDLTWVGNTLFCTAGGGGSDAARTSRAGRAGARASRTVRILRLFRMVKLYKSYRMAVEKRRKEMEAKKRVLAKDDDDDEAMCARQSSASFGGDDEDFDDDLSNEGRMITQTEVEDSPKKKKPEEDGSETRVGKKLSEMTTRRVIMLVLIMLFCLPQFNPSSHGLDDFRSSSYFGMDITYERWRGWCPQNSTTGAPWCLQDLPAVGTTPSIDDAEARRRYEEYLLLFLYTHHVGINMGRPVFWKLFWVGIKSSSMVSDYLGQLAQLGQSRFLGPHVTPISDWDELYAKHSWTVQVKPLDAVVKRRLTLPWQEKCEQATGIRVSSQEIAMSTHDGCSVDKELRCTEVEWMSPMMLSTSEKKEMDFMFGFDKRDATKFEATLNMASTVFICFAVGLGSMLFSNDANVLLLNPIQRMIAKMETIKDKPLEAIKLGDTEFRREELEAKKLREEMKRYGWLFRKMTQYQQKKKKKEPMETVILEKTIIKLGGLLALGFGETGAEVVALNMRGGSELNAAAPGQDLDGIFAVCGIQHFAGTADALGEGITVFVNLIAEIVHGCADDFYGAPNNFWSGQFLIVWRYSKTEEADMAALAFSKTDPQNRTKLADLSVLAFAKIIAGVNKSRQILEYNNHPALIARFPNFQVKIGVVMHYGWSIEGAVGSDFKIDAAYLSPHGQVAAALERATPNYGVAFVVTHTMQKLLSKQMVTICRLIDHVKVRGSRKTLRLYSIDLDTTRFTPEYPMVNNKFKNRFKVRQLRELRKAERWNVDENVWDAFKTDDDLRKMRAKYSTEFFQRFATAYRNYEAGQWLAARDMLYTCYHEPRKRSQNPAEITSKKWPEDGPTNLLLLYMSDKGFMAPKDWPGYRDLMEERRPFVPNALTGISSTSTSLPFKRSTCTFPVHQPVSLT